MIKLSCNSALLPKTSLEDALAFYRQIGLTRLELIHFMHGDALEQTSATDLAALLRRHGQDLIALYPRPIDIWAPDRLETSLANIRRVFDMADTLGVTRIVFPPLLPRDKFDYAALAAACQRLIDDLGPRQIRICLENHHGWPMDLAEDYRKLLAMVPDPRLGIALDTGHCTSSNVDIPAFIKEFAPRIHHIHIKDHIGTRSMPLGKGTTDNIAALRLLREHNYDGYASIELEVEDPENMRQYLRDAVTYCQTELGLT
jgi:sugar phosphate isomerase/epimerase